MCVWGGGVGWSAIIKKMSVTLRATLLIAYFLYMRRGYTV